MSEGFSSVPTYSGQIVPFAISSCRNVILSLQWRVRLWLSIALASLMVLWLSIWSFVGSVMSQPNSDRNSRIQMIFFNIPQQNSTQLHMMIARLYFEVGFLRISWLLHARWCNRYVILDQRGSSHMLRKSGRYYPGDSIIRPLSFHWGTERCLLWQWPKLLMAWKRALHRDSPPAGCLVWLHPLGSSGSLQPHE